VMLYEALTGQLPFVADSYSGLVLAVAHDPPRPPRELCPDIPRELEQVILQALSKQRQGRPPTVDSLHASIAPFARPRRPSDNRAAPPRSRARRNLSWVPMAVACVLALALLSRSAYVFLRDDPPASLPAPTAASTSAHARAYLPTPADPPRGAEEPMRVVAPPAIERAESGRDLLVAPRSCEEARRAGQTVDGLRAIDPDGSGPLRPFKVYCAAMASADGEGAREYLPLAADAGRNSTRFRYGQSTCPCPDLVRRFSRVRLAPATLVVDPMDGTFASYDRPLSCERQHRNQCGESTNLAWGGAGSCRGVGDTSGSASIDLSGTGFVLAPDTKFVPAGFGAAGSSVFSAERRKAQLSGGGLCGSLVPEHGGVRLVAER
jgi:hypothetical protein